VVEEFGGKARFVSENYGDSDLARRFGVTRYPAIFVDDVLVATPDDFGFYGKGVAEGGGRYAPLKSAASHERFRADLARMITLTLAGRKDLARAETAPGKPSEVATLPDVTFTDLDGRSWSRADLAGRPVLVEFWATWCPPCRGTLAWLGQLKERHADHMTVVAVAVQSEESGVRKIAADLKMPVVWTIATPELARAFGDVSAVPTLLMFDGKGQVAAAFYGAPPELHAQAEKALAALLD
jgi:thiol-disulfide isomerase/thioredoxin